ncbi:hypothetical protein SK128_001030 [Halocaridina rubra]|uniref:Uncharacterized protein n=1 Tax=Halocaridina rubra TaxID=373956 RepID=A0AAN8X1L3_HALRR
MQETSIYQSYKNLKIWSFKIALAVCFLVLLVASFMTNLEKVIHKNNAHKRLEILSVPVTNTESKCECNQQQPSCPLHPQDLKGRLTVMDKVTLTEAETKLERVKKGGFWWPSDCKAIWRVAIIVPYRNRSSQIAPFVFHMHRYLQRQALNYSIYIAEQEGNDPFNKGRVMNVGFVEAQKEGPWDCFAFHDIDMLPEDDRNLYYCASQPRHLAVAASQFHYKLPYYQFFGGAILLTTDQFKTVNGFSNSLWGWGGSDDEMWNRIKVSGMEK